MHSNSFLTQQARETGWKEVEESKGFPILSMRLTEEIFQIEVKTRKDRKCEEEEDQCQSEKDACLHGIGNFVWPVTVDEERLAAASRNSAE